MMEKFDISEEAANLTLSIYVLAYGLGPIIFSPLSEVPALGRNPFYVVRCLPRIVPSP